MILAAEWRAAAAAARRTRRPLLCRLKPTKRHAGRVEPGRAWLAGSARGKLEATKATVYNHCVRLRPAGGMPTRPNPLCGECQSHQEACVCCVLAYEQHLAAWRSLQVAASGWGVAPADRQAASQRRADADSLQSGQWCDPLHSRPLKCTRQPHTSQVDTDQRLCPPLRLEAHSKRGGQVRAVTGGSAPSVRRLESRDP